MGGGQEYKFLLRNPRVLLAFVKENKGGKFNIHEAMLPLLQKKGLTLPGHRYCGPGNPLDNGPLTNELDAICMEHDYCYSSNIPKSECDKNMLGKLSPSESKTFGDLVGMQAFSSFNTGFKYILTVIDVFSKYAWAVPIKDKSAATVTKAFEINNK